MPNAFCTLSSSNLLIILRTTIAQGQNARLPNAWLVAPRLVVLALRDFWRVREAETKNYVVSIQQSIKSSCIIILTPACFVKYKRIQCNVIKSYRKKYAMYIKGNDMQYKLKDCF